MCVYTYMYTHTHNQITEPLGVTTAHKIREISFKSYFPLDYFS